MVYEDFPIIGEWECQRHEESGVEISIAYDTRGYPRAFSVAIQKPVLKYFCMRGGRVLNHRYFPDFYVKYKDVKGKIREKVVEIKPAKQVKEPKMQKRRTKKYVSEVYTYATNQAKWAAAEDFCKDRRWEFQILTEKELGI